MAKYSVHLVQDVDIKKLLAGHQGTLLELLQWLCKFLESREPAPDYDPVARRAMSKHGGCSKLPRYGVSKEAFRRWRMQGNETGHALTISVHDMNVALPVHTWNCWRLASLIVRSRVQRPIFSTLVESTSRAREPSCARLRRTSRQYHAKARRISVSRSMIGQTDT
jgi:hypothetical protein